ncbi:hypothetical protein BKA07_001245 [Brevibacterium marinum]|uniref:Uncharacterized protein n=1 Tax=Brevibacterium marinum TaxID=418643 RepID=A0A846RYJ3_9MICO|nr:hypothetical protein [Brevibacterium marinum]
MLKRFPILFLLLGAACIIFALTPVASQYSAILWVVAIVFFILALIFNIKRQKAITALGDSK